MNKFILKLVVLSLLSGLMLQVNAEQSEQNTKLKQAINYRKTGNYQKALDVLSLLRSDNFVHKRINIELALNYIKLHQYQDAEQVIQHLQSLSLSQKESETIKKITRLLEKKLNQTLSVHNFSLDLGAGFGIDQSKNSYTVYLYDEFQYQEEYWFDEGSNADLAVDADYDYVEYYETDEYWDRERVSEQSEVSYQRYFVNGNYRYRPDYSIKLFGYPTLFTFDNDLTIDNRHYNQESNSQHTNYQLDSSLYLLQIDRWLFELNLQASNYQRSSQHVLQKTRGRLALTVPFGPAKVKLAVDRQNNDYHKLLQAHDAGVTTPWIELSYRVASQFRLITGFKYRKQKADDAFNSYDNRQLYLGGYYLPSSTFSAYLLYRRDHLHYVIDDLALVNWAKEDKRSLAFGLGYQILPNLTLSLNADIGDKQIELGFGDDDWRRVEASIMYRF
ncbi:hypothetical protein tinsulaeT_36340 [Thalassotalea insulae]|uniref:Tetratricopeptide repeat protein n=1 Tax=Thalassotalea insulae TaxID=2056778 RepID=A0ABQ6GX99_9GAMM|nr:hypothetical protein [Thalassotalea insulae]GLX80294.1 hypothetical protein tinsulaeT_36340 [Thalassotalea insulae]